MAAAAAMTFRNVVHCALAMAISFVGLAAIYLQLDAQFVGFAQILVYVGAVAILIVFAILLTRSSDVSSGTIVAPGWIAGAMISVGLFAVLGWVFLKSPAGLTERNAAPELTVRQIGDTLMTRYVIPLEVIGLLLTAAMIGAVVIAMSDKEDRK